MNLQFLPSRSTFLAMCLFLITQSLLFAQSSKVLVFSKTKGWHHSSIPFGIKAIQKLGQENNFGVDTTTNSTLFTDQNLQKYQTVIFNNTTGDVLNNDQQSAFERYIQAGGGFVGIHSATDTEYAWPWYGELVGAYFGSHPNNSNIRKATVEVTDNQHIASAHLPAQWERTDEWYNFKYLYHGIKPLAYLNENTYEGGTNGGNHPIAWYHEYDGGRAFYTANGHTDESYAEPLYLQHLLGGIKYAMGNSKPLNYAKSYSKAVPEENRFEKTVLVNDLNNPMELAIAKDGRVFFTELAGNLSVFNTKTNEHKLVHRFPLVMKGGTGLIGITLDPNFEQNQWMYLYYSPPIEGEPILFNLSRFKVNADNTLDLGSEKILLQVPVQINSGSHHGGSLAFDKKGNLFISTGDGTTPFPSDGYAPIDERKDEKYYPMDAQRSAANTNDFKGKILKIHPENDGTAGAAPYTIPEGNMFPKGMERTKPEIFAMGCRNPYRIAVNPKTSTVYWGEIGPDAGEDKERGPRGYDEFNQAKKPGYYGWPYFVGNNYAYTEWDFETSKAGPKYDPKKPINNSPNNTGLTELPPAVAPMIWYPYALSSDFPELGLGGRSAMAGEFYTFDKNSTSKNKIPEYYDGALFVFDWMRNWMLALRLDENENYVRNEKFMPTNGDFRRPIDLTFGNDGVMYVLEYGSVYGADNIDARLVKIEYNGDNRSPKADAYFADSKLIEKVNAQSFITSENINFPKPKEIVGKAPLTVKVAGRGTDLDFDDKLSYQWLLNGKIISNKPSADYTFTKSGKYKLLFKVSDQKGSSNIDTLLVVVGNEKPSIAIKSTKNKSFYWDNQPFSYEIDVKDAEDKAINPKKLKTVYNYNPQPFSPDAEPVGGAKAISTVESGSIGKTLMNASDCKACHTVDKKAVGPSFTDISKKYAGREGSLQLLTKKIIEGGGGTWGTVHVMAAHPQLAKQDVNEMVKYIFSLSDPKKAFKAIPQKGSLALSEHKTDNPKGFYTLKTQYTDNKTNDAPAQTSSDFIRLKYNTLRAMDADLHPGFIFEWGQLRQGDSKAYLLYRNIDLTGIKTISFEYASQDKSGEIEIRKNSVAGPIIGKVKYESTGNWDTMKWIDCKLENSETDFQDLYFVAIKKDKPTDKIIKFKSVKFD